MPDWTYHPAWRPVMFRLPGEDARRLTIGYLDLQGRTRIGRELFRLLSFGFPEAEDGVDVFGLRFLSRIGSGAGLDLEGRAGPVLQYLGTGFVVAGPVIDQGRERDRRYDRTRLRQHSAVTWSDRGYLPSDGQVFASLERRRDSIRLPVGVVVEGEFPSEVVARMAPHADFLAVRDVTALADGEAAATRAATSKPLLSRIRLGADDADVIARAERAQELGYDGVVLGDGQVYDGLAGGWMSGPAGLPRLVADIRAVVGRFGDDLPVVAAGGMVTPVEVRSCLDAGAALVEVSAGLVYSGPGIIARSLHPEVAPAAGESPAGRRAPGMERWGIVVLLLVALALLVLDDAEGWLLRAEGRGTAAASVVALAALWGLCVALLRRRQDWAWWPAVAIAAAVGLAAPAVGVAGVLATMALGRRDLMRGFRPLFDEGVPAWRWSPANLGRRTLQLGAAVAVVGALACAASGAIRGLVAATAVLGLLLLQRGLRPGLRTAWVTLAAWAGLTTVALVTMVGDAWRWPTAALGSVVCLAGLSWLFRPLVVADEREVEFPDV